MNQAALEHVLRSQQFNPELLRQLFMLADQMEKVWEKGGDRSLLSGCWAVNLFLQPSTRTHTSFRVGQRMLGIETMIDCTDPNVLSLAKAETIHDTVRTFENMVPDPRKLVIVVRHADAQAAEVMAKAARGCKIMNAGCGKSLGQHVTQAIQDGWTILKHGRRRGLVTLDQIGEKKGKRRMLHVAMVGDMRNGRTVRSLVYLLSVAFPWVKLYFYSPPSLTMGRDILQHLDERGIPWEESSDTQHLYRSLGKFHVLYDTRFQQEDLGLEDREQFTDYQQRFQVNARLASRMKEKAIIMHPLPRNNELTREVDNDPRAAYFDPQIKNGVIVRMALMYFLLKGAQLGQALDHAA